jgi:hypothetical protein
VPGEGKSLNQYPVLDEEHAAERRIVSIEKVSRRHFPEGKEANSKRAGIY